MFTHFDRIHELDRHTDGHAQHDGIGRAMHSFARHKLKEKHVITINLYKKVKERKGTVDLCSALRVIASKGPFIATQLNSTGRPVELSCVGEVSIATPAQLNSTQLNSTLKCL